MTTHEILGMMRIALETSIRDVKAIRPAGIPPPNVTVVWHTGYDTVTELLDQLNELDFVAKATDGKHLPQ